MNIIEMCAAFAQLIKTKQEEIISLLLQVQSVHTTLDEINRSVDVLETVIEIEPFLKDRLVSKISSFLPLNLPLYSTVLFACIPSMQTHEMVTRAPTSMQKILRKLVRILELNKYFPNIKVDSSNREEFMSQHVKKSQVVLFTGRPKNFRHVQQQCSKHTLVLFNGAGHNPLVVSKSADIDLAVEKTVEVKLFNNGQDCAGSDAILVHQAILPLFTEALIKRLHSIPAVDTYNLKERGLCVGSLYEVKDLQKSVETMTKMLNAGMRIIYGGNVDLRLSKVFPTVLIGEIGIHNNYTELYAPIFPILAYQEDSDLSLYFSDEKREYREKEMYVSLFGHSHYLSTMRSSILLQDKSIHDVERGNYEYGGFGTGASAWSYKGLTIYKPLLIPQEIHRTFGQKTLSLFIPNTKGSWHQKIFTKAFPEKVEEIFGENLIFGYGFGSFAVERDARTSDIDTMVCVREMDERQTDEYLDWIVELHHFLGRVIDFIYPTEVVTFDTIQKTLQTLSDYEMKSTINPSWVYDGLVWGNSLGSEKIGVVNSDHIPSDWQTYMSRHQRRLIETYLKGIRKTPTEASKQIRKSMPAEDIAFDKWLQNKKDAEILSVARTIPFEEHPTFANKMLSKVNMLRPIGASLPQNNQRLIKSSGYIV